MSPHRTFQLVLEANWKQVCVTNAIPRFGYLLGAFEHILWILPKAVRWLMANDVSRSKAELQASIVNLLCVWKTGKEGQILFGALSGRVFLEGQLHNPGTGWNAEQVACAQAPVREEIIVNQSQSKAKSKDGICAGFWFDRRGHKDKRSDGQFQQMYISRVRESQANS